MALISSSWIFEEHGMLYCYWPVYIKSTLLREKVVKNHTPLIPNKCLKCAIMVKHSSDDYEQASLKLRKLEEDDFSQTDSESRNSQKKSCKSTKRDEDFVYFEASDISDDEDHDIIPVPPKFPKEPKKKSFAELKPVDRPRNNNNYFLPPSSPKPKPNQDQIEVSPNQGNYECHCEKTSKMVERLLRDMQTIKLDVRSLVLELNNNKLTQYQQLDAQLRFKDYQELQKFNESLLEEDYFNKMQASISLLGGRDLNDTTRKILSLLVSHELSLNINWIGANEKGSFQKLENVLKLTYGAVRRNQATANATNSEIDNAIRNWLKNAPDRAGGRANRKNKK
ncbi:unnamed protein product [Phaedon cochleariae]|nr:unnamed protein product [Phaedon cochleariae]